MFKYAVIKCKDCGREMDVVPFMSDVVPFGIGLSCCNCGCYVNVACVGLFTPLSDFFCEVSDDLSS